MTIQPLSEWVWDTDISIAVDTIKARGEVKDIEFFCDTADELLEGPPLTQTALNQWRNKCAGGQGTHHNEDTKSHGTAPYRVIPHPASAQD